MPHDSASPESAFIADTADFIWRSDTTACSRLAAFCAIATEDIAARLHVHASTTWHSLADALKEAVPSVVAMLSPADYATLARDFVTCYPPTRAALYDWGQKLTEFLIERSAPAQLIAMAQLDRAWMASFFAADAAPIGSTILAKCAEAKIPQTRLILHPSINLVRLEIAWFDEWCARAALPQTEQARESGANGTLVVISRPQSRVRAVAVTPATFGFLNALQTEETLLTACEIALNVDRNFKFQSQLAEAFAAGLITGCLAGE